MAVPRVKTTYSLDLETVARLDRMASAWGVSKSEALRRLVRSAEPRDQPGNVTALSALDELQQSLTLSPAQAQAWSKQQRAERRSYSRRSEARGQ